ncbi:hypothetical protein HDU93_002747 [Gonapodya sp. JEL0774]|nr:hypothetical protein HDU93_002747 [Gonapodya sp. JEL0774]
MDDALYNHLHQAKSGPKKVYGSNNDIPKELRRERDLLKKLHILPDGRLAALANDVESPLDSLSVLDSPHSSYALIDADGKRARLLPVARKSELDLIFADVHNYSGTGHALLLDSGGPILDGPADGGGLEGLRVMEKKALLVERHVEDKEAGWTVLRRNWYVGRVGLPHQRSPDEPVEPTSPGVKRKRDEEGAVGVNVFEHGGGHKRQASGASVASVASGASAGSGYGMERGGFRMDDPVYVRLPTSTSTATPRPAFPPILRIASVLRVRPPVSTSSLPTYDLVLLDDGAILSSVPERDIAHRTQSGGVAVSQRVNAAGTAGHASVGALSGARPSKAASTVAPSVGSLHRVSSAPAFSSLYSGSGNKSWNLSQVQSNPPVYPAPYHPVTAPLPSPPVEDHFAAGKALVAALAAGGITPAGYALPHGFSSGTVNTTATAQPTSPVAAAATAAAAAAMAAAAAVPPPSPPSANSGTTQTTSLSELLTAFIATTLAGAVGQSDQSQYQILDQHQQVQQGPMATTSSSVTESITAVLNWGGLLNSTSFRGHGPPAGPAGTRLAPHPPTRPASTPPSKFRAMSSTMDLQSSAPAAEIDTEVRQHQDQHQMPFLYSSAAAKEWEAMGAISGGSFGDVFLGDVEDCSPGGIDGRRDSILEFTRGVVSSTAPLAPSDTRTVDDEYNGRPKYEDEGDFGFGEYGLSSFGYPTMALKDLLRSTPAHLLPQLLGHGEAGREGMNGLGEMKEINEERRESLNGPGLDMLAVIAGEVLDEGDGDEVTISSPGSGGGGSGGSSTGSGRGGVDGSPGMGTVVEGERRGSLMSLDLSDDDEDAGIHVKAGAA